MRQKLGLILIGVIFVSLTSCDQNRSVPIKVALVYKMGVQPVARSKFYLLRTDITKEKFKDGDGVIGDSFYESPAFARYMTEGGFPRAAGLNEDRLKDYVLDSVTTDFDGNGSFQNVKPGTYWIVGYTEARAKDEFVIWNLKAEINSANPKGKDPIILDQNNAYKVASY